MSEWREVPGYHGRYWVSRDKQVKSINAEHKGFNSRKKVPERMLTVSSNGYVALTNPRNNMKKQLNFENLYRELFQEEA